MRYFAFGEKHKLYLSEIKMLMKIFESINEITNSVAQELLSHACHMPRPPHSP
jgi:hypothetical protein